MTDRIIYALKVAAEVVYVGYTKSPKERLYNHKRRWPEIDEMVVLESVVDNWRDREHFWIQHFRDLGVALRNKTTGRNGVERLSEETKAKLSAIRTGKKKPPHTEEAKAKMRAAKLGKKLTEEHKAKIGAASRGIPRPPHVIEALRIANTGRKLSDETKLLMSSQRKGRKASDETKAKLSAASKGRKPASISEKGMANIIAAASIKRGPMSEEHKAKIKASRLAGEARRRSEREAAALDGQKRLID